METKTTKRPYDHSGVTRKLVEELDDRGIKAGNGGDFAPFYRLNEVLQRPFTAQAEFTEYEAAPAPDEVVHETFCGT